MDTRKNFALTAGLLALALAVGGAGVSFPLLELLLDCSALAVASYFALSRTKWSLPPLSRIALILLCLILLLPLAQLIPLPNSLWSSLPGRSVPVSVDDAVGWTVWRPVSLDAESTVRAFVNIIPAAVVFIGCIFLPTGDRTRLLWVVVGFALLNAVLGIFQFATGGAMTPYPSAHLGYPIGLFVNRNHNATLLLVSLPIVAVLGAARARSASARWPALAVSLTAIVILSIVVIATTSRMGAVLLPVALASGLLLLFFGQSVWRIVLPSLLALVVLALGILAGGGFSRTLARFSSLHDSRFDYWTDIYWALHHYGLAGTGFGTFPRIYESAESLDAVTDTVLNHAHNDYLELLLDGGIPAVILLVFFVILVGFAAVRLMRFHAAAKRGPVCVAAGTAIVLVLVFSLVDYPMRMPAISCAFAMLCSLLFPDEQVLETEPDTARRNDRGRLPSSGSYRRISRIGGVSIAPLVLLSLVCVQVAASSRAIQANDFAAAERWMPWSTRSHEGAATKALLTSRSVQGIEEAQAALQLSPISVPAIRTLGLLMIAGGASSRGANLMSTAAVLGWRDLLTQLWAINAAEDSGEPEKVLQRSEALFRQNIFYPPAVSYLVSTPDPRLEQMLVARLAERPDWRQQFFASGGDFAIRDAAAGYERLVKALSHTTSPTTILETQPLIDGLLSQGDVERAQRLWLLVRGNHLIANGDFEQSDGPSQPSNWDVTANDLSSVSVGEPDFPSNGKAVRVFGGIASGMMLSQRLLLAPGKYSFSFDASSQESGKIPLLWELRCQRSNAVESGSFIISSSASWRRFRYIFTVPKQDCRIQRLALRWDGVTHPDAVWLDNVGLSHEGG